jgi:hypothetical protein
MLCALSCSCDSLPAIRRSIGRPLAVILALTLALIAVNAYSQRSFPPWGEIRVSDSTAIEKPPSVGMRSGGETLVIWGNGSKLYTQDLISKGSPPGYVTTLPYRYGAPFFSYSLRNDEWAALSCRGSGDDAKFRFERFLENTSLGFSQDLINLWGYAMPIEHFFVHEYCLQLQSYDADGKIYGCYSMVREGCMDGITQFEKTDLFFTWEPVGNVFFKGKIDGSHHVVSQPRDGGFVIYSRNLSGDRAVRKIRMLKSNGDPLSDFAILDSLPESIYDLSERVAVGTDGNVFIVRRRLSTDSLIIQRFGIDGNTIEDERPFLDHVSSTCAARKPNPNVQCEFINNDETSMDIDFRITRLADDRSIAVWTRSNDGLWDTDIYCGLLDQNMNWLCSPKRVNGESTGLQEYPHLAVTGDTVCVVWLDSRNGPWNVYMRRFLADEITASEREPVAEDFAIGEIFPHPARDRISYTFTPSLIAEPPYTAVIQDALGRVAARMPLESDGGKVFTMPLPVLPSGLYRLVISNGNLIAAKTFVIAR